MLWGLVIGAVIGAGIEIIGQVASGKPMDWTQVGKAALVGAVTGLVGGAVAGAILKGGASALTTTGATAATRMTAATVGGGAGGGSGRVVENALDGRALHDGVVEHTLAGAVLGGAASKVEDGARVVARAVREARKANARPVQVAAAELPRPNKILLDKQSHAKHVNPKDTRGIMEHPDPEGLIARWAGKGQPTSPDKARWQPGYKERVDFGERIGQYAYLDPATHTVRYFPTTVGSIHYKSAGNGNLMAHIVPQRPIGFGDGSTLPAIVGGAVAPGVEDAIEEPEEAPAPAPIPAQRRQRGFTDLLGGG